MRLPIGYALAWPDRAATPFGRIDWSALERLDFEPPDRATFRCLDLAYQAGRAGGPAPAWLNAANEVAVQAFLDGAVGWSAIADIIQITLDDCPDTVVDSVEVVLDADRRARERARRAVERSAS
jgi:1-deoxy-D-xylulose-5-phosphate reductoisomerase